MSVVEQIRSFLSSYWIPLLLIAGAIIAGAFARNAKRVKEEVWRWHERRIKEAKGELDEAEEQYEESKLNRKRKGRDVLLAHLKTIISMRRVLTVHPLTTEIFSLEDFKSQLFKIILDNAYFTSADYLLLNDFHDKLKDRNSYISRGNINEDDLRKYNQECLDLSEQVITKINWITPAIDNRLPRE
jgi:hypothetical protein